MGCLAGLSCPGGFPQTALRAWTPPTPAPTHWGNRRAPVEELTDTSDDIFAEVRGLMPAFTDEDRDGVPELVVADGEPTDNTAEVPCG